MAHSLFSKRVLPSTLLLCAGTLGGCTGYSNGPHQVRTETPSVTYTYRNDQELAQASQSAATYCSQYQSYERTYRITSNNADGSQTVVFECAKPSSPGPVAVTPVPAMPAPVPTPMSYTYRTDQELLDASRNAEAYCMRSGMVTTSTIVTNANGTKTVSFQCTR
jgi:hypothetical protein